MWSIRIFLAGWLPVALLLGSMSCAQSSRRDLDAFQPDFLQAYEAAQTHLSPQKTIWPETLPQPAFENHSFIHIVKWERETLFSIAGWYTGSGNNWKRLAAANPDIAPNKIHIGDAIAIPFNLLITHRRMPADYVTPKSSRNKTAQTKDPLPPANEGGIDLYGPIGNDSPATDSGNGSLPVPLETIE